MRITIDTAQDSKEHIKKAIELLRSMIEGGSDTFSNPSGFQDMFGSPEQPSQQSSGGIFDMFNTPTESSASSSYPQPTQQAPAEKPPKPKGPTFQGFEMYE